MGIITKEYYESMVEHVWYAAQQEVDYGLSIDKDSDELKAHYAAQMSSDSFSAEKLSNLFKSISGMALKTIDDKSMVIENDDQEIVSFFDCLRNDFISDATSGFLKYESLDDDDKAYVSMIVIESIKAMAYKFQELGNSLDFNTKVEPPGFLKFNKKTRDFDIEQKPQQKPPFSVVYQGFLKEKISGGLTEKIQGDYARFYSDWEEIMEDKEIDNYKRKDIESFLLNVSRLPKRNLKPYKGKAIKELLGAECHAKELIAPKSVSQYKKWIQGVFAYARDEEIISTSPVSNLKVDSSQTDVTYALYSDSEVRKLVEAAIAESIEWHKWVVLIGVYTGMRLGEIHALHSSSIRFDDDSERYYILVTDEYGGRLKTEAAKRTVPVHMNLIKFGFLEWSESKSGNLFSIRSKTITQWFGERFRDLAGVSQVDDYGKRKVFHSLRHSFITKARSKSVSLDKIQQVVGHEKTSAGITDRYTHKYPVKDLLEVVDAIDYGL
ncbi:MAG: DUF3258 domain-containing protein [Saccharospirillaceae bacterium]|nr:DUF3258 domain-containing protein [Saccharospirillaceae bacterium]MCD8530194.1 DUF3258 domain-containing protein [Saccharospirillaceae bacterium]